MTYKEQLLENMQRELLLLKRLATHIEPDDLDFRPTEKTRSTHELMQYLSGVGSVMIRWLHRNDVPPEERARLREENKSVTIADFPQRIDKQWADIKEYMEPITEQELLTMMVELPWKERMTLGSAIMNAPIKWLASYRMQLFVNLKINGKLLETRDAWVLNAPVPA